MGRARRYPLSYMQEISVIGLLGKISHDIGLNGRDQLRVEISARSGRGERIKTTYFTVYLWQTFLEELMKPGMMIYVQGELRVSAFIDSDGKARPSLTIYGNNLYLLGDPFDLTEKEKEVGYVSRYDQKMETLPEIEDSKTPPPEDEGDDFFGKNGEYPF